jgi:type I restriction enzyme S subunit
MASEWRASTWGEEISLEYGKALRGHDVGSGSYRVFGSNGAIGWTSEALSQGPGVILGRKGAYRGVRYSREPFFVIDTAYYVVPKSEMDMRWLYYAIQYYKLGEIDDGSPIPSTTRAAVYMLDLDVPPLPEQRAIAHILGLLDDKIEVNRRMSETLEAMARAFFKSWFVDFDPVHAKVDGRDPGLPRPLADLFPNSFEDSELGEIPKGWRVGRFGDVVEQLREQENPLSSPETLYQHFSLPAFDEGQSPKIEYGETIKSQKSRVPSGVVLLSKLNPEIERVWLVDVRSTERAVCSTEFLVLRARPPFTRSFVYCFARSPLFRQQIEGLVTGTSKSHQRAQSESILNLAAVIPDSAVAAAFDRSADNLLARTLECRRASRTLAALRDTLLPKLVSGELRVGDAERFVGTLT